MEADAGATARRKGGKVTKSSSAMDADKNEGEAAAATGEAAAAAGEVAAADGDGDSAQ